MENQTGFNNASEVVYNYKKTNWLAKLSFYVALIVTALFIAFVIFSIKDYKLFIKLCTDEESISIAERKQGLASLFKTLAFLVLGVLIWRTSRHVTNYLTLKDLGKYIENNHIDILYYAKNFNNGKQPSLKDLEDPLLQGEKKSLTLLANAIAVYKDKKAESSANTEYIIKIILSSVLAISCFLFVWGLATSFQITIEEVEVSFKQLFLYKNAILYLILIVSSAVLLLIFYIFSKSDNLVIEYYYSNVDPEHETMIFY